MLKEKLRESKRVTKIFRLIQLDYSPSGAVRKIKMNEKQQKFGDRYAGKKMPVKYTKKQAVEAYKKYTNEHGHLMDGYTRFSVLILEAKEQVKIAQEEGSSRDEAIEYVLEDMAEDHCLLPECISMLKQELEHDKN